MKRGLILGVLLLGLFIFLSNGVEAVQYANCAAVPAGVLGGKTCVNVNVANGNACGSTLGGTGQYYLLTENISTTGSCITLSGSNNVLDLNEHKITFGTGGGSDLSAILLNSISGWKLTNGYLVQGGTGGTLPTVVRSSSNTISNSEFSFLKIYYHGADGAGIQGVADSDLMVTKNVSIHDNYFNMSVTSIGNRMRHHAAIGVKTTDGAGGKIYNNVILGSGQKGIGMDPDSGASSYDPFEIYNNTIIIDGYAANSIAIASGTSSNNPSTSARNVYIHDNFINMTDGRGIYTGGIDNGVYGLANSAIYNNYIETRQSFFDPAESDVHFAMRIRYGAQNMTILNNTIKTIRTLNNEFTPLTLAIAEGPIHGGNIKVINNIIITIDTAPNPQYDGEFQFPASLWLTGPEGENSPFYSGIYFEGNRFVSDNFFILMPGTDGGLNGSLFFNNTFEKGPNYPRPYPPTEYRPNLFWIGWGGGGGWGQSFNNTFLDSKFVGSGVSWDYIFFNAGFPGGSYFFTWTTHVKVRDAALVPIRDALVTIKDKDQNVIYSNQPTDSQGYFKTVLQEFSILTTPSKIPKGPYNISVFHNGERQIKPTVYVNKTLTGADEIVFTFDTGGNSPDVNSDGLYNVKDLAIVVFNQGRAPTGNYAHLDLNSDGAINWADVQIVVGLI